MPSRKPKIDAAQIAKSRKLIANSCLDGSPPCCVSKPYPNNATTAFRSSAKVVDVLTEPGGAAACEYVLPETAKAIVAAFAPGGWSDALDEIERLRKLVDEACDLAKSAIANIDTAGDERLASNAYGAEKRLAAIRKERG